MKYIKRTLFNELKKHLIHKEISLIVGPRQAGKTTLMNELMKYLGVDGKNVLFLNLDFENDKIFFKSQDALKNRIELEFGDEFGFVFIDEIQRKENAGLFLKGIYDMNLNCKFIVSGSGSLELKEKIHESLAGRKRMFELSTITFDEFVDYKTDYKYSDRLQQFYSLEAEKSEELLKEYLNFGGFPRVVIEKKEIEKNKIINEIFKSYVEKDVACFLGVDRVDAFELMIKVLATQTGQIVKYAKLSNEINVVFATLKKYLWYAEKTFSIKLVGPYFKNKHKEITQSPTVYFNDIGLRNYSVGVFGNVYDIEEQIGFVFQNFIFNKLYAKFFNTNKKINFWRTVDGAEVDFVIVSGVNIESAVEVKYSKFKKPIITRSMKNFIKKYSPRQVMIVNIDFEYKMIIDNTTVKFIPYYKV